MTDPTTTTPLMTLVGDTVRIGHRTPAEAGLFRSTLRLPGGFATYDVRSPTAFAEFEIVDARSSTVWVSRVLGDDTAAQLALFAETAAEGDSEQLRSILTASPEAEALSRLALGQWLWRYWPASTEIRPIDIALLQIELAALAWQIDECFGPYQPAGAYLSGATEQLAAMATQLAASPDDDSVRSRAVVGALDALVVGEAGLTAGIDADALDEFDRLLTRIATRESVGASVETADREMVDTEFERWRAKAEPVATARRVHFGLAASGADDDLNVDSVDWEQVPPRALEGGEGTVSWTVQRVDDADDLWQVAIRVIGAPGDDIDGLFARGYLTNTVTAPGLPVLVVALRRNGGVDYVGETTVTSDDLSGLVIDVYGAASVRRPRVQPAARGGAAASRADARRLITDRQRGTGASNSGAARLFEAERDVT